MAITVRCINTCTVPKVGYVDDGEVRVLDIDKFDIDKYKYLKHFELLSLFEDDNDIFNDKEDKS